MLIRFVVENFLSFDKETEFNMLVGNFKTHKNHVYPGSVKTLRAAAIYGANGAGKSNIVKAIEFFQDIIKDDGIFQPIHNFKFKLNSINKTKPITFELEFLLGRKIYRYGFTFDHNIILSEWLIESGIRRDDKIIFERTTSIKGKTKIRFHEEYIKNNKQKIIIEILEENLLKPNETLLSKEFELKIKLLSQIKYKITDKIIIIYPHSKVSNLIVFMAYSKVFYEFSNTLLKSFDTGIKELKVETFDFNKFFGEDDEDLKESIIRDLESGNSGGITMFHKNNEIFINKEDNKFTVKKLTSSHIDNNGNSINFELDEESDGTQRLLDFIPAFNGVLTQDMTFIIDEIDQSLHPVLLKAVISKIMLEENTKGQLIFTTHESNLLDLDIFRQDEIWFVEKNKLTGGSAIYSLSDYKPRYDLDIRKGYLKGRFGGIPFLANLDELNWNNYDSEKERV
ncbi:hypothetical protein ASG31_17040 [Chryseobacterium sp. Leaf404]|uniref:AAA family ATPase n=1 Tax=unclassified Chryseobacterium TaxID=2593645 RepID=UPI0006F5B258|nr:MULTISPECIES: ATP-binding protein [unclassified Chryseobacterium]KQT20886.1 hypothetical protein ASG31_17040 [Chryseobacterium sp. Leaf404]